MPVKTKMSPAEIVAGIEANLPEASEELYTLLQGRSRYHLWQQCGETAAEDYIHDIWMIIVEAIRRGDIRVPGALRLYIQTLVKRKIAQHIDAAVFQRGHCFTDGEMTEKHIQIKDRRAASPETEAIRAEQCQIIMHGMSFVNTRDREIIERFYVEGQNRKEVCRDMNLSETQFRLRKTRAKAVVVKRAQRRVVRGKNSSQLAAAA